MHVAQTGHHQLKCCKRNIQNSSASILKYEIARDGCFRQMLQLQIFCLIQNETQNRQLHEHCHCHMYLS